MSRGGKRAGSGRRRVLTPIERLFVGSECEERWRAERDAHVERQIEEVLAKGGYRGLVNEAHEVPIDDREAWLRGFGYEYHRDDIEGAIHEMSGFKVTGEPETGETEAEEPEAGEPEAPRRLTVAMTRPYAVKERVVREVADWATERYGKSISPRLVQTCWTLFRKLQADGRERAGN